MSNTFKPKYVPSDVVSRWPSMALALWKRSFKQQALILMAAALIMKLLPAWSAAIGFLIAPSLFVVSFAAVQIADERTNFSWAELLDTALPGALKLGYVSLQFAACFGLGIGVLSSVAALVVPHRPVPEQAQTVDRPLDLRAALTETNFGQLENPVVEFLHFFATWTEGVMAMVLLGLMIVVIYQGVFGAILHGLEGIGAGVSRVYGWQAWQVNAESIENALRNAPARFFHYLAILIVAVICGFQTVYLSPVGLVLATYMPCLTYVAYRSIFLGRHENVAAAKRAAVEQHREFAPAWQRA
jgi:hypothetical protein